MCVCVLASPPFLSLSFLLVLSLPLPHSSLPLIAPTHSLFVTHNTHHTPHTQHTQHTDDHVNTLCPSIIGVRELLGLRRLTAVTARSLEPEPGSNVGGSSEWCNWHLLSLGAFCPSVTALACLPLHTLSQPFPVSRLDLTPLRDEAADHIAACVEAAVTNMATCQTLVLTEASSSKLEVGCHSLGPAVTPLPGCGPVLRALAPLAGGRGDTSATRFDAEGVKCEGGREGYDVSQSNGGRQCSSLSFAAGRSLSQRPVLRHLKLSQLLLTR